VVHAIAFSDKAELTGRFIDTRRENFKTSLDDLLLFADRRRPPGAAADDANGGTMLT
jgi:enoyl-[acyl-carrier protein] reductase I